MTLASVKVAVRVRCLSSSQQREEIRSTIQFDPHCENQLMISNHLFTFDHVFRPEIDQQQVYDSCVMPLFQQFINGHNATILAYGQTGSGKTYSMGTGQQDCRIPGSEGIIPRFANSLFQHLQTLPSSQHSYGVQVTFLELANEELIDLLKDNREQDSKVNIRKDEFGNVYWGGVREISVRSTRELLEKLYQGSDARRTGETDMNLTSSRSHAIFSVLLRQCITENIDGQLTSKVLVSKFHFVDLAGSERLKRTHAVGERAKEGIAINSELLALGNVISALGNEAKRGSHIPYRDSKLTRLLQDSLGGNSQTLMLACASPAYNNLSETINTLQYANRARNIKNRIHINQEMSEVDRLKAEIMRLRHELRITEGVTALHDKLGSINTGEEPAFANFKDTSPYMENDETNERSWDNTKFINETAESMAPIRNWVRNNLGDRASLDIKRYTDTVILGRYPADIPRPRSMTSPEMLRQVNPLQQSNQNDLKEIRQTLSQGQGYAGESRARRTEGTFLTENVQPQFGSTKGDNIKIQHSIQQLDFALKSTAPCFDFQHKLSFETVLDNRNSTDQRDNSLKLLDQEHKLKVKAQRLKFETVQRQLKSEIQRLVAENRQSQKNYQIELHKLQRKLSQSDRLHAKDAGVIQKLVQSIEKEKGTVARLMQKAKQDAVRARESKRQHQCDSQKMKQLESAVQQRDREVSTLKKQHTCFVKEMVAHAAQMKLTAAVINNVLKKKAFDSKLLAKAIACVSVRGYLLNQWTTTARSKENSGVNTVRNTCFERKLRLIQRAMSARVDAQSSVSQINILEIERENLQCEQRDLMRERDLVIRNEEFQQMKKIDRKEPQYMDEYIDLITAKIRYFDTQIHQLKTCTQKNGTTNSDDDTWMKEADRDITSFFSEPDVAYEMAQSLLQSLSREESQQISISFMEDWVNLKKECHIKDTMNKTAQTTVMQLLYAMVKMRREPSLADACFQKIVPDCHFEHGLALLSQPRKMQSRLTKVLSKKYKQCRPIAPL